MLQTNNLNNKEHLNTTLHFKIQFFLLAAPTKVTSVAMMCYNM